MEEEVERKARTRREKHKDNKGSREGGRKGGEGGEQGYKLFFLAELLSKKEDLFPKRGFILGDEGAPKF